MAKEKSEEKEVEINEDVEASQDSKETVENEEETPQDVIENLQTQLQDQKDKYLRLFADFDNYKKRTAKERLDLLDTASKDVIINILPTLDDFDRAMNAAESAPDVASVVEGMGLIRNKLFGTLEQRGLAPMDCVGEAFDPEKQEAITEIPAPSEDMKGKVIDQIEKGYTLNGKIIRYAKVVVGK